MLASAQPGQKNVRTITKEAYMTHLCDLPGESQLWAAMKLQELSDNINKWRAGGDTVTSDEVGSYIECIVYIAAHRIRPIPFTFIVE